MNYQSTKTFGHDLGLSCCFRQHRADSHCRYLHGYSLSVKLVFETEILDKNGWVIDFGDFKEINQYLINTFDHKLLISNEDPLLNEICQLGTIGLADVVIVPATGCEAFSRLIFVFVENWMYDKQYYPRVNLVSVEVKEHGANSGIHLGEN